MRARIAAVAVTLACLTGSIAGARADENQRLALVIGNSKYATSPLKNPANDARAVAKSLRERGFEVLLRENATKKDMETAVADFGEKMTEGATGLFFFAGHGMQVNGRNFLIPIDASITSEQRVRLETLDVDVVLDQMAAAHAKVSMMILDACRNNPFERRFRSVGGGLAQINAPEGTLISYATAPGKVAADGDGDNGLYTQEFLKALSQPGLRVEDVFKQVRVNVSRASNGAQIPWEASSLTGDFYFLPPKPVAVAPPPAAPVAPAAPAPDMSPMIEMAFWDAVKSSTNPAEFRAYIQKYPNGNFSPLAQARLAALTAPPPSAPAPVVPVVATAPPAPAPVAVVATVPPPAPAPATPAMAAPEQIAALPAPTASESKSFDGRYSASYRATSSGGMSRGGTSTYKPTIEILGTQIAGFMEVTSVSGTSTCRMTGTLSATSGDIQRLEALCGGGAIHFLGQFALDTASGNVVGSTKTRQNGESIDVRWVRN